MRELEKVLKQFDASLVLLTGRMVLREEEIDMIRRDRQIDEIEKRQKPNALRMKSIEEVREEVEVVVDLHFFNEFSKTKSSSFLKKSYGKPERD